MLSTERSTRNALARILIIDDEDQNVRLLARILKGAGYQCLASTTDPAEAVVLHKNFSSDLVLLDVHMEKKNGMQVLTELVAEAPENPVPVLMITADDTAATKHRALGIGAKDFVGKPFDSTEVLLRIRNMLETHFLHEQLRDHNLELEAKVAERTRELEDSQIEALDRLATAVEFRDYETGNHTRRVAEMSALLAERLGVGNSMVEIIRRAAPLHDIGKVGIPDGILLKPGALTPQEFEIMKSHTVIGSALLSNGRSDLVRVAERIARSHHEWWNGEGYPDRINGDSIPLEARIVAVADFADALTHDRPYRAARGMVEAFAEVEKGAGTHFDPHVAETFLAATSAKL